MDNNKTLEILNGIAQAAANCFDGALDSEGNPISVGLKREKGHPVLNSRDMDGFNVKVHGDLLIISYHTEIKIKKLHNTQFENEQIILMNKIVSWLKSEYNKITKKTLVLKALEEPKINVQYISRVRNSVTSVCKYKISGIDLKETPKNTGKMDKFLKLGGWKTN